jgi:hypothetical protein
MYRMKLLLGLALVTTMFATVPGVSAGSDGSTTLDGVYRVTWTGQELMAAGASSHYVHEACQTSCVFTLTLRNGHLWLHAVPTNKAKSWTCPGTDTVSASIVSIAFTRPCRGRVVAKSSLHNGTLRFRVSLATDPGDKVLFGAKPWKKVR